MRETEFDLMRWVVWGVVLIALALASFSFPAVLWAFVVILAVALADIIYVRYFKGRIWA